MTLPAEGTLLILSGIGVPLFSWRGLTQTLTPIQAAVNLRRDINGTLFDLSRQQFQKYASKITVTDVNAPAFDGIWPGMQVTVHCVCELGYPTGGVPGRPVVPGSDYVVGNFTYYRPILVMRVMNDPQQIAEWPGDYQTELDLEEV
jgi:hypothetical protein